MQWLQEGSLAAGKIFQAKRAKNYHASHARKNSETRILVEESIETDYRICHHFLCNNNVCRRKEERKYDSRSRKARWVVHMQIHTQNQYIEFILEITDIDAKGEHYNIL